jgi:hypothetical protein
MTPGESNITRLSVMFCLTAVITLTGNESGDGHGIDSNTADNSTL